MSGITWALLGALLVGVGLAPASGPQRLALASTMQLPTCLRIRQLRRKPQK